MNDFAILFKMSLFSDELTFIIITVGHFIELDFMILVEVEEGGVGGAS